VPPLSSTVVDISAGQRIGAIQWENGNTDDGADGTPMNGMECVLNMPDEYHVHTYVAVIVNGDLKAIPQNIGIVSRQPEPRCFYPIHTHDGSGKIHIESSGPGTFTLGHLFDIWGQPLNSTNVAGLTGMPVEVFVADNGVVTKVEDNWDDIELTSKRLINIVVGTPVTELPNVTWSGD
jgi:hypothetical protein